MHLSCRLLYPIVWLGNNTSQNVNFCGLALIHQNVENGFNPNILGFPVTAFSWPLGTSFCVLNKTFGF